MSFGAPHRHWARTDSTNTRARELATNGAPHGTVVTAGEQTEGRGRQGRTWVAPPGGALLYSAILRPLDQRHALLPLAIPLAVCEAAEALEPAASCKVKWPNDVWLDDRKMAGILIEARPQDGWVVLGIGLNLTIPPDEFPPDLRSTAISLFGGAGGSRGEPRRSNSGEAPPGLPPTPHAVAEVLSCQLDRWVEADPAQVLQAWKGRDALRGSEVSWDGGSGVADGIDDRGYLLVITPGGDRVALGAGEVHLTVA